MVWIRFDFFDLAKFPMIEDLWVINFEFTLTLASWQSENTPLFLFTFTVSLTTITQKMIPCLTHKHAWKIHKSEHMKMGILEQMRGGRGKDRDDGHRHSSVPTLAPVSTEAVEKLSFSPRSTTWNTRGTEGVLPQEKSFPFPLLHHGRAG